MIDALNEMIIKQGKIIEEERDYYKTQRLYYSS